VTGGRRPETSEHTSDQQYGSRPKTYLRAEDMFLNTINNLASTNNLASEDPTNNLDGALHREDMFLNAKLEQVMMISERWI